MPLRRVARVFNPDGCSSGKSANIDKRISQRLIAVGGIIVVGTIYEQTLPLADVVYATEVNVNIEGDTYFPLLSPQKWTRQVLHSFPKNDKNEYDFEVVKYEKIRL